MSANRLYYTWFERIRQLRPDERITRLRNLAWLMVGIYQSRSVHLSDVASKIPGRAKELSIARRLSRCNDPLKLDKCDSSCTMSPRKGNPNGKATNLQS